MNRVIWRPFTQMQTANDPLMVHKARGARLFLADGREVIDAISSWWVITHGHCQEEISRAIADEASRLDQVLFANLTHLPATLLIEHLSQLLPAKLSKFFFSDNGSTAVEVALKMLTQYWQQAGALDRKKFISFAHAYHGDTVGAMSVSADGPFTEPYKELMFPVIKVEQGRYSQDAVESFTKPFLQALSQYKHQLAGIIIEPLIQGAGGMVVWPVEALEIIGKEAHREGVPLIFDEVMTGFGRTGTLFAFEQLSFAPDILCLSKGLTGGMLPLSLTVATEEIYRAFLSQDKGKMFLHGHSFTGNPISCAAAVANLQLIKKGDWQEKCRAINKINRDRIKKMAGRAGVKDTRILGTIAVVEFAEQDANYLSGFAEKFSSFALSRGVFLRPLGNIVYILPPYSITPGELHRVWDVIEEF